MINLSYDKFVVRKKSQLFPILLRIIYFGVRFENFFGGKNFPDGKGGLDLSWHKIIYPASRFKKYSSKRLIPGYFLKLGAGVYFVVFPDFQFYKRGIILNDKKQFTPKHIFKIDLKIDI